MRVVFLLTEISVGGAERVVLDLCSALKKLEHEVYVVALKNLNRDDIMVQAFQRENVEMYSLNMDKKHPWRALKLKKIISKLTPDVISAHLFHPNILSRLLLTKRKFKLINTVHIMEIRDRQKWRFTLDKMTFNMADVHTAVSQATADFQCQKMGLPPDSFKVIRNGIRKPHTPDSGEIASLRRKWGVDECDIVFGCVGRLNYQKGFDILLKMQKEIAEKFRDKKIGLVFIGDGQERENLQKLAETPPENMKITFAGYSANAASECGAFDVFLMPSRFEGFGLTLAEAMSHGLPTVIQQIPPLEEVAADYPNAVITDFNDTAKAIESITESTPKKRLNTGAVISVDEMADNYLKLF